MAQVLQKDSLSARVDRWVHRHRDAIKRTLIVLPVAIVGTLGVKALADSRNANNTTPENTGNNKPGLPAAVVNREVDPESERTTLPTPTTTPSSTPSSIPPTRIPPTEQATPTIVKEPIIEPTKKIDVAGLEAARKFIKESPGSPSIVEKSGSLLGTDLSVQTWVVDTRPGIFSSDEKLPDAAKNKIALDTARAIVPEIIGIKKVVVILLNAGDISMDAFMRLFPNSQDVSINPKSANERKVIFKDGQAETLVHIMNAPYLKIDPYKYYVNGLYEAYNTKLATKYATTLSAEQRAVLAGGIDKYEIYRTVLNTH